MVLAAECLAVVVPVADTEIRKSYIAEGFSPDVKTMSKPKCQSSNVKNTVLCLIWILDFELSCLLFQIYDLLSC